MRRKRKVSPADDPLWYKDAIIYELHVRAYADDDGDGIGDFAGLTKKLDYIQQLGVTAVWLLPFYPSPLKDEGYDIADYRNVNPTYGTLRDFEKFLIESHRRGLRVITELPINHTSDRHMWFQRARRARPGSRHRNFYVWSGDPERYGDARIIFKDFEHSNWTYDHIAHAYYWHRFYAHQPDLNFDNPAVHKAVFDVLDFWLSLGVDGVRLDAIPYLYEREGTDCENLPETHAFLKKLRRHVDAHHRNRLLLAEANQWPEDAAAYFGDGDECHMNFHFPLMPRLFMSLYMEDRYPIIDILQQTPVIPESAQWGLFLRNHDELTLEMVTDEERDYMYRVYAQDPLARINLGIRRRLAPLLGNNRRRVELMNALLLSLPGTPIIYYGDELGMGDNIYLGDRDGVRTPMQWSPDRNAGFSAANPQSLYLPVIVDPEYHYATVNAETQGNNPQSLLWWMKRIIALRKRFQAFGRGTMEFLFPENRKVLGYVRRYGDEIILVVANLSRYAQGTYLDLRDYEGLAPVEVFGRSEFPVITTEPYFVSLGPHAFFWFALQPREQAPPPSELPVFRLGRSWEELLEGVWLPRLEHMLPAYLVQRRWFGGKARTIDAVHLIEAVPVALGSRSAQLCLFQVSYTDAYPETYLLPLAFATGAQAADIAEHHPQALIANLSLSDVDRDGLLYDAIYDPALAWALLSAIDRGRALGVGARGLGEARGARTRSLRKLLPLRDRAARERLEPHVGRAEQSNTSVIFGDRLVLKLYRRLEDGINPDLELGTFLSEKARFTATPRVAGHLDIQRSKKPPITLALLAEFVPNEGDAWQFSLDEIDRFLESVESHTADEEVEIPGQDMVTLTTLRPPAEVADAVGTYWQSADLLGRRTAQMHLALASETEDPSFAPEPFTPFYRRSMFQSLRNLATQVFELLRRRLTTLPPQVREDAARAVALEQTVVAACQRTLSQKLPALRIRIHGDYHLGQVLYTGRDFVIIDFEGEPALPLGQRRLKRSPLRDVAGMLRSLHYAAHVALRNLLQREVSTDDEARRLARWAELWHRWVGAAFLGAYLDEARDAAFVARMDRRQIAALLNAHRVEKVIYELGYELNNRPDWVPIPLLGLLQIAAEPLDAEEAPP